MNNKKLTELETIQMNKALYSSNYSNGWVVAIYDETQPFRFELITIPYGERSLNFEENLKTIKKDLPSQSEILNYI